MEQRAAASNGEIEATTALLARIPLFGGCSAAQLERLAATAYPIAFDPGDVICAEGADSTECYVIADGEAIVKIGDQIVSLAQRDEVIGEKGPLEQSPRAATVSALTHTITYAISREHLLQLVRESPAAAAAMRAELSRRYAKTP